MMDQLFIQREGDLIVKCLICGKEFTTNNGMGGHITQKHKISTKQYYDEFLSQPGDGYCAICGKPTSFKSFNVGYFDYCLSCSHNTSECKEKRKNTTLIKYGVDQVLKSSEVRNKIKQTILEKYGSEQIFSTNHFKDTYRENSLIKYGTEHPMQNKEVLHKNHIHRRLYYYDNTYFDSSWELAVYIYYTDHNISILREPIQLTYLDDNNKTHKYFPDFIINDKIIEIKGNQFLTDQGTLLDTSKQKCIDQYNIEIWSWNEVYLYIEYCKQKFNTITWYRQFKIEPKSYNENKKIKAKFNIKHEINEDNIKIKSKSTSRRLTNINDSTIHNPKICLICNKEFYNGNYLSSHLKFEEHISGQEYYDKYLKKPNEGQCIVCGKNTKYINFTRGYQKCCSQKCNNNPLSDKGKLVSKTKQSYTLEQQTQINYKRQQTCLEKYGVKSNLSIRNKTIDI